MAKHIVIVEDNELNLKLFCDLLTSHGYTVVAVRDGKEGVDVIRKESPNLVLMDIQLHGISGIDLIKEIKADENLAKIPVIAVTAFAMKDDKERIMKSGCEAYISKPISIAPFLETVEEYITKGH